MKPRLGSLPHTEEDSRIWTRHIERRKVKWYQAKMLNAHYIEADCRDANLMFFAHRHPNRVRSESGHLIRSVGRAMKNDPGPGQW